MKPASPDPGLSGHELSGSGLPGLDLPVREASGPEISDLKIPDLDKFERKVFKKKNTLDRLLSFSMRLLRPRQVGLVLGTNKTWFKFLPPDKWDRGVMHKFNGQGMAGMFLKYFGTLVVKHKGLSPIMLYRDTQFGEKKESPGIISFVLRKHRDFYKQGIKILIIDNLVDTLNHRDGTLSKVSILSFDGHEFKALPDLKIDVSIVRQFKARNFVSAYVPDYGAIVFNTIDERFLAKEEGKFIHETGLKDRLNILISAIEMASLAHIGLARGRQAARIIWRKEKSLRKAALQLKHKEIQLNAQRQHLKAVGAVNERQLSMEPVNITDGVYGFMDMVGSASVRTRFIPRDYFFMLNLCLQIAADNAGRYACRVDNIIGDAIFFQNASPFDDENTNTRPEIHERTMLMVFALASTINDIHRLKNGRHHRDAPAGFRQMMEDARADISFRAGLETGSAMIGPLGSDQRKVVTAIGKAVNTASRLESTGVKEKIHVSGTVKEILTHACISRDTPIARRSIPGAKDAESGKTALDFFDTYKTHFGLTGNVVEQWQPVVYKEFSPGSTYLIKCLPDPVNFSAGTCGI